MRFIDKEEIADFYPMRGDFESNSSMNEPERILVSNYGQIVVPYKFKSDEIMNFLPLLTRFSASLQSTRSEKRL